MAASKKNVALKRSSVQIAGDIREVVRQLNRGSAGNSVARSVGDPSEGACRGTKTRRPDDVCVDL